MSGNPEVEVVIPHVAEQVPAGNTGKSMAVYNDNTIGEPNLEHRLRNMMMSNGIPGRPLQMTLLNEPRYKASTVPPHLQINPSTKEEIGPIKISQKGSNLFKSSDQIPRKKTSQAQRKRGAWNQLDLSTSSPSPTVQSKPIQSQSSGSTNDRGQPHNNAQVLPAAGTVIPHGSFARAPNLSLDNGQYRHSVIPSPRPVLGRGVAETHPWSASGSTEKSIDGISPEGAFRPSEGSHHSSPRHGPGIRGGPPRVHQGSTFNNRHQRGSSTPYNHAPDQSLGMPFVRQSFDGKPRDFTRPPTVPGRQLFEPSRQQSHATDPLDITRPLRMQADYLDGMVTIEVVKAEMGVEELQEKENLRLALQSICREIIASYESEKTPLFSPDSVVLKCFGSLSSGYATQGSDMDLVLVSPSSSPDTSSPESALPRLIEKVLLDQGYGARLLTRTRVPIIRFCEKPNTELLQALRETRAKWDKSGDIALNQRKKKKTPSSGKDKITDSAKKIVRGMQDSVSRAEDPSLVARPKVTRDVLVPNLTEEPAKHREEQRSLEDTEDEGGYKGTGSVTDDQLPLTNLTQDINGVKKMMHPGQRPEKPQPQRTDEELLRLYLLAIHEDWFSESERAIIYRFEEAVKTESSTGSTELADSRTALQYLPDVLSKYRDKPQDTHLDFPKEGVGIQCDINFSNFLAIHNTLMLRCYSHCDPRIRPMVLFVKAWAKRRKINSPYHGTLSSYGYVLMVLHYVVNIASPPLAPNLQISWKASSNQKPEDLECSGCDVRFWRDEQAIRSAACRGLLTQNYQSVGSLLRGFFQYFAQEGRYGGFSWSHNVLSLRTHGGLVSKQEKGWTGARTEVIEPILPGGEVKEVKHRYLFAIEDPFEIEHNVARPVVHHGICAIRDEFRRAHRLIQSCGYSNGVLVDLFEEGNDHVQERSYFGPNPARFVNRPKRFGPQDLTKGEAKADGRHGVPADSGSVLGGSDTAAITSLQAVDGPGSRGSGVVTSGAAKHGQHARSDDHATAAVADGKYLKFPASPISLKEDSRG
ncbi:hypothetical protein MMC19_004793 [Ptychographa xylographoides]|nr:hypothetical protein [Ptychographa xylographoides]